MRTNRFIICQTGSFMCACGALARDGADACEKCISRARWARRKARRMCHQPPRLTGQDLGA
jgi:hypothetical protein